MPEEFWANAIFSVIPTLLILGIFWFIMRSIVRADRTSRRIYDKIEAEERAKAGLPPKAQAGAAAPKN